MGNSSEINNTKAADVDENTADSATESAGDFSRAVWNEVKTDSAASDRTTDLPSTQDSTLDLALTDPYKQSDKNEQGAPVDRMVSGVISSGSDEEAAKTFESFVKREVEGGANHLEIAEKIGDKFGQKDSNWAVDVNSRGELILRTNPPEPRNLFDMNMYSEGEPSQAIDPDAEPDRELIKQLSSDFAKSIDSSSSPAEIRANLTQALEKMKQEGIGPRDADKGLNRALEDANLPFDIRIRRNGEVTVRENHPSRVVAVAETK